VAEPSSGRIELYLLGGTEMRGIDSESADRLLAQPKLTALMALMALSPAQRPQRRDRLVGILWPELDQAHARTALRKAIHALRGALGAEVVVARGDEDVGFARPPFWCDAVEIAESSAKGQMAHIVELYRGDLMTGFHLAGCVEFERWLDGERESVREHAAAAALGLAALKEQEEHFTTAGRIAKKAVSIKWDDERVLRRAMQMLVRIGDHAGALRLYESFAERMRTDLEASPSAETQALANSLRERS
jgi:serine/threonine-protein kinase